MNKNSISSIIVKNYQFKQVIKILFIMKDNITLLNNFIELRTQPVPLTINKSDWINRNYDILTKFLFNKSLLLQVNNFINQYNKFYKIDENIRGPLTNKKILSIWLILAFPEYIIDTNLDDINTNKNDYKIDLYILTKELHNILMSIINDNFNKEIIRKFNKQLNLYINSLDYYLLINKREKLSNYIREWIELEKSIKLIETSNKYDNNEKNQSIFVLTKSKNLIEKYINKFIEQSSISQSEINNINMTELFVKLKDIVVQQINLENNLKITMEIILNEQIENNDYSNLIKILEQIKTFILSFTKISEDNINEILDIDYIVQLIRHDVLTVSEINEFGLNLLNNICSAGSISLNNQQIKEWENIVNEFKDNYKLIIGKLLRLSLESISLIIEEIACFQEYLLLVK
jgi:hypothetical protein